MPCSPSAAQWCEPSIGFWKSLVLPIYAFCRSARPATAPTHPRTPDTQIHTLVSCSPITRPLAQSRPSVRTAHCSPTQPRLAPQTSALPWCGASPALALQQQSGLDWQTQRRSRSASASARRCVQDASQTNLVCVASCQLNELSGSHAHGKPDCSVHARLFYAILWILHDGVSTTRLQMQCSSSIGGNAEHQPRGSGC